MERIRAEKQQLIKEGKIKRDKNDSYICRGSDNSYYESSDTKQECIDDILPFDLPNNWTWSRLSNIFQFIDYRGKTPSKIESGIPLVTASNVRDGYMDYTKPAYISQEEYDERKTRGVSKKGDILFTTEAPLGKVAIADLEQYSAGQRVICLSSYFNEVYPEYFMYFMLSPFFQKILEENSTGTTAKGIKAAKLKDLLVAIPPYGEQIRICKYLTSILDQIN